MADHNDNEFKLDFVFDWSDKIIEKLWEKHKVNFWEVEEVVLDDPDVEIGYYEDDEHGVRWMARGVTANGRTLRIYLNPCKDRDGTWFVITAWGEG